MAEIELYDLIKILHITAVISWLAGLLYLPRIFVYHAQVDVGSEADKIFQIMEKKAFAIYYVAGNVVNFCFRSLSCF